MVKGKDLSSFVQKCTREFESHRWHYLYTRVQYRPTSEQHAIVVMMIGASSIGSIYENVIIFIAHLAQTAERKTFNLVVESSNLSVGIPY